MAYNNSAQFIDHLKDGGNWEANLKLWENAGNIQLGSADPGGYTEVGGIDISSGADNAHLLSLSDDNKKELYNLLITNRDEPANQGAKINVKLSEVDWVKNFITNYEAKITQQAGVALKAESDAKKLDKQIHFGPNGSIFHGLEAHKPGGFTTPDLSSISAADKGDEVFAKLSPEQQKTLYVQIHDENEDWQKNFVAAFQKNENKQALTQIKNATNLSGLDGKLFSSDDNKNLCYVNVGPPPTGYKATAIKAEDGPGKTKEFFDGLSKEQKNQIFDEIKKNPKDGWQKEFCKQYETEFINNQDINDVKIYQHKKHPNQVSINPTKAPDGYEEFKKINAKLNGTKKENAVRLYFALNQEARNKLVEMIGDNPKADSWQNEFKEFHENFQAESKAEVVDEFDASKFKEPKGAVITRFESPEAFGDEVQSGKADHKYNISAYNDKNKRITDTYEAHNTETHAKKYYITNTTSVDSDKKVNVEVTEDAITDKSGNKKVNDETADAMAKSAKAMFKDDQNIFIHANSKDDYLKLFKALENKGVNVEENVHYKYLGELEKNSPIYQVFVDAKNEHIGAVAAIGGAAVPGPAPASGGGASPKSLMFEYGQAAKEVGAENMMSR